jgi:MFS family permease
VAIISAAVACLTYFVPPENRLIFFVLVLLYGGFSFSIYSLSVAHTQDQIELDYVMDATRTLLLFNGVGAAIGPILAGVVMQLAGSAALMLFFGTVLGLLGIFAVYRLNVAEPIPVDEQEAFVPMARTSPEVVELDPRLESE